MRIGISILTRSGQSVWQNGIEQNVFFLAACLAEISCVEKVFLIDCGDQGRLPDDANPFDDRFPIVPMSEAPDDLDLVIDRCIGAHVEVGHAGIDLLDGAGAAFGRYWGALERVDCLHFEACYYSPLQWCIAHGLARFEGGAQGEHKMARALMPVKTTSAHWLAHPAFAEAVDRFLAREGQGISSYMEHLDERSPFRHTGLNTAPTSADKP